MHLFPNFNKLIKKTNAWQHINHVMCVSLLIGDDWKTRHGALWLRQASYYHTSYALVYIITGWWAFCMLYFSISNIRHWMKYVKFLQFIFIDCQKRHIGSNIATYAPFHYIFFLVVLLYKTFCPQIDISIIDCLKLCRVV